MQIVHEGQRFPVKTLLLVTDFLDGAADGRFNFFLCAGCPCAIFIDAFATDFACKHNKLRGCQCFTSDARFRVFRQKQIDNRIRNLIRNLVGMAFRNRFGREEIIMAHGDNPVDIRKTLCVVRRPFSGAFA